MTDECHVADLDAVEDVVPPVFVAVHDRVLDVVRLAGLANADRLPGHNPG